MSKNGMRANGGATPRCRKVLIVKPSSLGDIVHALPTLHALRSAFPQAAMHWVVKRQWAGILKRVTGLDRVWTVDRGIASWLSTGLSLRAEQFDLVVDLQGLFRSGALTRLTGCARRVGFANGREGSPLGYTERVHVPAADLHAVDRYLLVAAAVGATRPAVLDFGLVPTQDDLMEIDRLLVERGLPVGSPWIAVNPAARWLTKRWPAERFARLADAVQQEGLARTVLIGGADDRSASDAVARGMGQKPIDMTGATPLRLLPALLRSASLLVTNDSGPMHVAAAVNTPVVALFGPTSASRTGPYGAGHRVLSSDVPCRPCFSRRCHNAEPLACLSAITPEVALQAVRSQLALRLAH